MSMGDERSRDDHPEGGEEEQAPAGGAPRALQTWEGPSRAAPYPLSRLAPPHGLIDVAREIQQADALLGAVTGAKLETLARQIRRLQEEARVILEEAQRDGELHRVACSFKKRPGQVYYLYRRSEGSRYFSMLSPEEWGGSPPHGFEGGYRLEADMSWTPEAEHEEPEERPRSEGARRRR
ncbi:DUF2452 domain-containing protein [Chondromyces apiculatus]|uniref:DUF2452 domain-containing protein n=1 Tax=Chondromyces apiculatus DSM 436 TaxID=1192034 RepID=A0A017TBC6_9BACT|nr:DUF2452 domain-containing protein [Chondromyces apiculatus]EYF05931.1 Hypothetical protein CAP_2390 [Chondromyces apiculatus DSM 436]